MSHEIDQKTKVDQNTWFFLDIFDQLIFTTGSSNRLPMHLMTMVTMGPVCLINWPENESCSEYMIFSSILFPNSFQPLETEKGAFKSCLGGSVGGGVKFNCSVSTCPSI